MYFPSVPFTFAHPAAVLPLTRLPRWLAVPSALAVGSMSPDFWYILPGLGFDRGSGHNLAGVFRFCLPASLVLWLLWRLLIGPSLLLLLPEAVRHRLRGSLNSWRLSDLWAAPLSIILGAMTHVVWDHLAHDNHAELLPLPDGRLHLFGHQPPLWKVLQMGSSILGMTVLGLWFVWTLRRLTPGKRWIESYWPGPARMLILAALLLGPFLMATLQLMPPDFAWTPGILKDRLHAIMGLYLPLLAGTLLTWSCLALIARMGRDALNRS